MMKTVKLTVRVAWQNNQLAYQLRGLDRPLKGIPDLFINMVDYMVDYAEL